MRVVFGGFFVFYCCGYVLVEREGWESLGEENLKNLMTKLGDFINLIKKILSTCFQKAGKQFCFLILIFFVHFTYNLENFYVYWRNN